MPIASHPRKALTDDDTKPIPYWIAKHPIFIEKTAELLDNYNPPSTDDPFKVADDIKMIIRAASKAAIKEIFRKPAKYKTMMVQSCLATSTCI